MSTDRARTMNQPDDLVGRLNEAVTLAEKSGSNVFAKLFREAAAALEACRREELIERLEAILERRVNNPDAELTAVIDRLRCGPERWELALGLDAAPTDEVKT